MAIHNLMGFNRQWTAKSLPTVSGLNCSISQAGNYQLADRAGWNSHIELTTHALLELIPQSRLKSLFNQPMHPMSTIWGNIKKGHSYTVQRAHRLLWHGGWKSWTFGEYYFHKYDVVGKWKDLELKRGGNPIPFPNMKCRYWFVIGGHRREQGVYHETKDTYF